MGSKWSVAQERHPRKQNEPTAIYMASLVKSCDEAIIGTNLEGRILSWNTAAEQLFGYSAAEIIGRSYSLLVPPYRPDDLADMLTRIRDGDHVEPCETVRLRKNGTKVEVLLTLSPVKTAQGRLIGASILAHDITQRKLEESEHGSDSGTYRCPHPKCQNNSKKLRNYKNVASGVSPQGPLGRMQSSTARGTQPQSWPCRILKHALNERPL